MRAHAMPSGVAGRRQALAAFAALALAQEPARASLAPDRPLRLLTGFPAGATLDVLARLLADEMKSELGRPVVVDNRTGASGRIANEALKSAAPDGATLLIAPIATLSIFPHSFGGALRYDPFRDFAPVAHIARFPIGFGVGRHVPADTLAEFVALARREPAMRTYGSSAMGSIPHFLGLKFARAAGIELSHVPYRGAAQAMAGLAGGEIAALAAAATDVGLMAASGQARLLATAGRRRAPAFPHVPTFQEAGYDIEGEGSYALFLPAGTPVEVVQRTGAAALAALKRPTVRKRLDQLGLEPTGLGPVELAAIVRADHDHWGPTVRASGLVLTD